MKIFYFTGCGNSLSVAKALGGEIINIAKVKTGAFKDEAVGFVFPVYCYDIPPLVKNFIQNSSFEAGYFFAVGTCGSTAGRSFLTINGLLKQKGKTLDYSKKIVLPDTCIIFKTAEETKKVLLAKEKETVEAFKKDIENRVKTPVFCDSKMRINRPAWFFMKKIAGLDRKKAGESCVSCGLCSRVCPMQNIKIENGKPSFGKVCENCFACIQRCPSRAITFGKLEITDQSHCVHPDIKLDELTY